MLENYFTAINTDDQFSVKIQDYVLNHAEWEWVPSMFVGKNLSQDLIKSSKLIDSVNNKFGGALKVYKIPSRSVYGWHQDMKSIGCSINLVYEEYHCHTLFSTGSFQSPFIQKIIELEYSPNVWYAFNSKMIHTVINLDQRDRYLTSYTLPETVSYKDLVYWLKDNISLM